MTRGPSKLPCDTCGGQCCSWAPFLPKEFRKIQPKIPTGATLVVVDVRTLEVIGFPEGHLETALSEPNVGVLVVKGDEGTCAFLKEGRCSVYTYRPHVCRALGVDPRIPCPILHPEAAQGAALELFRRLQCRK